MIRASFSQERMQYLDQAGTVVYTSGDGATTRNFPALEWLAAMCSHIPNRGEQMVRYYGYYSKRVVPERFSRTTLKACHREGGEYFPGGRCVQKMSRLLKRTAPQINFNQFNQSIGPGRWCGTDGCGERPFDEGASMINCQGGCEGRILCKDF